MCGKAHFPSSPKALMGSLNKMNFIRRFSALCLRRKSKMQQRHQSSRRPAVPLGSRILTDPSKVFEHNMWDHMQWSQEEEEQAKEKAAENSLVKVQLEDQEQYEREASKYWNEFYKTHRNNFFKDRNWLFLEFPEILPEKMRQRLKTQERSSEHTKINITNSFSHKNGMKEREKYWKKSYGDDSTFAQGYVYNKKQSKSVADNPQGKNCEEELGRLESFPGSGATYRILEVGCGAGNSVFPILKVICNTPGTFLYCCDFASGAVELVKSHSSYNSAWCSAFVHDVCDDALPYPFPDEILDVILLVFVLSTIHPDSKTRVCICAISTNLLNLKRTKKMQGRQGDNRNSRHKRQLAFYIGNCCLSVLSFVCNSANLQFLLLKND
nr:mRNA N(3)-methylcytidine methyltransferase METTL8 isoform X4 [Anser cygnoides]